MDRAVAQAVVRDRVAAGEHLHVERAGRIECYNPPAAAACLHTFAGLLLLPLVPAQRDRVREQLSAAAAGCCGTREPDRADGIRAVSNALGCLEAAQAALRGQASSGERHDLAQAGRALEDLLLRLRLGCGPMELDYDDQRLQSQANHNGGASR